MNLKKLFNINYFKENIRKSKGLLAFFLGIIPIINIVFLIIILTVNSDMILTLNMISIFAYLGLFFIPVALSMTLFGFIFKKKSVDFVMSKPLSRKSIFITNTLGGIIIILVFVLLNTLIFGFFSLAFSSLTIPLALLWDYFVIWLISYIFMFVVSNLAIVIAGNFITSLVVLLVIVSVVPFLCGVNYVTRDYYSDTNYIYCDNEDCKPEVYYCYNDSECEEHLAQNEYELYYGDYFNYHFLAPYHAATQGLYATTHELYDAVSLMKMLVLSIIYTVIAYFIFKHRKMENNETSFKSTFAHFLLKAFTFLPVCLVTYLIISYSGSIGWLIAVVAIIIYSLVYDLITRREIYKFWKSTIYSLLIFGIFTLGYYLNFEVFVGDVKVIKEVDSIIFEGVKITDDDLINTIVKSLIGENTEDGGYSYNFTFQEKNKTYTVVGDVNPSLNEILMAELVKNNEEKISNFNFKDTIYIEYNHSLIPVTSELITTIEDSITNITDFDLNTLDDKDLLYIYYYDNHTYESIFIPVKLSEELYTSILTYQNDLFIKFKEKDSTNTYYYTWGYDDILTDEDYYVFSYVLNSFKRQFLDYLKNDNEIAINKEVMFIYVYDIKDYQIALDVESFQEEFAKYKEALVSSEEYQSLLAEYHQMVNTGEYYEY